MINALNHSRPPSYRSHISDHPVIETAGNGVATSNTTVSQPHHAITTSTTTVAGHATTITTNRHSTGISHEQHHVQVAQVHAAPGQSQSPGDNQRLHSRTSPDLQLDGHGGQDVSIVPVSSSRVVTECKTDLLSRNSTYHVKTGSGSDICDVTTGNDLYEQLFVTSDTSSQQEKRSVVTIVQTSATNSEPVIVTVSGSLEQRLNTSSDSGSDFSTSEIRASPAEVEILATL